MVANSKLKEYDGFEFGDASEETFDHMVNDQCLSINHAPGVTTHYNRVIVLINPVRLSRMTAVFFLFRDVILQEV
jgi:hypothetical protein